MKKQILLISLVIMALIASCGKAAKTTATNPTASVPVGNVCFEKSDMSYNETSAGASPSVNIIVKNTGTAIAKNIVCTAVYSKASESDKLPKYAIVSLDKTTVTTEEPNNTLQITIRFPSDITKHEDYKNLEVTLQWEESYDSTLKVKNLQPKTITIKL